ncbi:unnamed protein product [Cochlearia groenlandica]
MAAAAEDDYPVYVAVSKDVGESRLNLEWALRNLQVNKLYLTHVHQQIEFEDAASSGLEQSEIDAIHESERNSAFESLCKYHDICLAAGVMEQNVEILWNPANDVGEGIVELIYQHNIKKLVIGAAADSHYSEGMVDITSTKAEYVSNHAPQCCKIWLVCNGNLIQTREGRFDIADSPHASSGSLNALDSALVLYEGAGSAEPVTESETEELNRAKEEIEDMKRVQKELQEQLHTDCPLLLEMFQKERDEAVETTRELLRLLSIEDGGDSSSSHSQSSSEQPPPYFICPISKEVMKEPCVAADGFTYETEILRQWLDSGHETSPMTNLNLAHINLVPNHSLRSAIQEWLQRNP